MQIKMIALNVIRLLSYMLDIVLWVLIIITLFIGNTMLLGMATYYDGVYSLMAIAGAVFINFYSIVLYRVMSRYLNRSDKRGRE
jgi:uncharacterized membrane protein (DUF373 family)